MEVILQKEVLSLGREGDIVKVAGGYANNYLFPKGLAVPATKGNLKQLELKRKAIAKRDAELKAEAQQQADKLTSKPLEITVRAGAEGRLYGSVTAKDIAEAVEEQTGIEIDKRRLELHAGPIKQTGETQIKIKLHPEVEAVLAVNVTTSEGAAEAAEAAETEESEEKPENEA